MRYDLTAQEVSQDHFKWTAGDGAELIITKSTIATWITEESKDAAISHIFATMNNAFANSVATGTTTIEVADDGTPIDCVMER